MPAKFQTFERDLKFATAGISPDAIARELAKFAKSELADAIRSGAASPVYERIVNSRVGAAEETVVPPGPIVYVFSWWPTVIRFALDYLERRSPRLSGEYIASHTVMVNGRVVTDYTRIGAADQVVIVNTTPYARKAEMGGMKMLVPDGIMEDAVSVLAKEFGGRKGPLAVDRRFINLPNGYILKGRFRRGHKAKARTALARDTKAGARMTYPAVVMDFKTFH